MNLDAATAELWFAGKQLKRGKLLLDHFGRNEKTKVVVKLQEAGMGRPLREPVRSFTESTEGEGV